MTLSKTPPVENSSTPGKRLSCWILKAKQQIVLKSPAFTRVQDLAIPDHSSVRGFSSFCYAAVWFWTRPFFIRSLHLYTRRSKGRVVKLAQMLCFQITQLPHAFLIVEVDPRGTSGEKGKWSCTLEPRNVHLGCLLGSNEGIMKRWRPFSSTEVLRFSVHCPESSKFIPEQSSWADVISTQHTSDTSKAPLAAGAGAVCSSHSCMANLIEAVKILSGRCLSDLAAFLQCLVFSEVEILLTSLANRLPIMNGKQALRRRSLHTLLSQLGCIPCWPGCC